MELYLQFVQKFSPIQFSFNGPIIPDEKVWTKEQVAWMSFLTLNQQWQSTEANLLTSSLILYN